jgi:plastocyanin
MGSPTVTRAVAAIVAATIPFAIAGAPAGGSSAIESPRATAAATKKVRVGDDFYAPKRLKVAKGTRIKWVWSSGGSRPHDVYSNERPEGVPHFYSPPRTAPFSFTRKLRKSGRYTFLCTFHERMRMRIDVTR